MGDSAQLDFDDFTPGDRLTSPGRTIGEAHLLRLAGMNQRGDTALERHHLYRLRCR